MKLLQNEHYDLFDARFIRFEWNLPTLTPSVLYFTSMNEADDNHQCVVVPTMKTSVSRAMNSTLEDVNL